VQPTIPHLTRSALHRCLQRPGMSRLPDVDGPSHDIAAQCTAGQWTRRGGSSSSAKPSGFAHRHCRIESCRGQALSLCGH
jgi:hypothetical protein